MRCRAKVIKDSTAFPTKFRDAAKNLHSEVQRLKEHRRLQNDDVRGIKAAIDAAIENILKEYEHLFASDVSLAKTIDHDPVFKEIEKIIGSKVGPPFSNPEEAAKVGRQRLEDEIPPGYSDYDKEPDNALGDYFLWEQTIAEAEQRKLPVLIVSNDGKEDWVRKEDSYARGPRPEMVDEMLARAGHPFHLVNVKAFLTLAKAHLSAKVSDSTIEQAESVQQSSEPRHSATVELWRAMAENLRGLPVNEPVSAVDRARAVKALVNRYQSPRTTSALEEILRRLADLSIHPDLEDGEEDIEGTGQGDD
jgi:PIN like domain